MSGYVITSPLTIRGVEHGGYMQFSNGEFSVCLRCEDDLESDTIFYTPAASGEAGQVLTVLDVNGRTVWTDVPTQTPVSKIIDFVQNGIMFSTTSPSYEEVNVFSYQGTENESDKCRILAVGNVSPGGQAQMKITDVTNANIISETGIIQNSSRHIIHFGDISNLPSSPAILSVSVRAITGQFFLESIQIL